jgi:outer membrane receptor protein involved in Fe transport
VAQGEALFEDGDDLTGPLVRRGHAGVEWTWGSTAVGLNAQHFSSYRAAYGLSNSESGSNAEIRRLQGRNRIPAQTYVDLSVRHRFSSALEVTVGVINILDSSPPIVADRFNNLGYSFYGDPRRRRFELVLLSAF